MGFNFCDSFVEKIGNGYNPIFWAYSWIEIGIVLSDKFLRLYKLEINKEVTVGDKRVWRDGEWVWRWDWSRELRRRVWYLGPMCDKFRFVKY